MRSYLAWQHMDLLETLHTDEQLSMLWKVTYVTTNCYYFMYLYIIYLEDTQYFKTNCVVQLYFFKKL